MKVSSLAEAVVESAAQHPERVAIKIKNEVLTYGGLIEKSSQVANTLKEQGANKEAIGIVGQRHMASYAGVLGVLLAGCYYVPINPKLSKEKIISIINDSNIKLLVGDVDNFSKIKQSLNDNNCKKIVKKIVPFELAPESSGWLDKKYIDSKGFEIDLSNISKGDLAYVMYTSGSTGKPKGVRVMHKNVIAFLENMETIYPLSSGFRASQMFDFSFDPSVSDMLFTWSMGGVLCVVPEEEIFVPYEFIQREKINFWNSVPSTIGYMKKMGYLSKNIFPSLRHSMFCGEQFPQHYAEEWSKAAPNSTIENLYGPTEATIYTSRYIYLKEAKKHTFRNGIISIGSSFPSMKINVIDDDNQIIDNGGIGELAYKGPQVTNGYLNDQEKTDSVFVKFDWDPSGDIWYKSGDLGFYNEDGNLECVGRKDSQIKLGGRRIELGEIESVLSRFPLLQDSVVVAIKDENQIVTGCIAFTMSKLSKEDLNQIRKESLNYLEKVFFPKKILTIKNFPRSPSGKIDRKLLTQEAQSL
jgi:amino acid adenylation domain-containing protein